MKCFFNSSTLNGHCSGAIIQYRYPECEMYGIYYGDEFPWNKIILDEKIFMLDFCLSPFEDMELLNKLCKLIWIDQYKAVSVKNHNRNFIASGGQSIQLGNGTCESVWNWCFPYIPMPLPVYFISRYAVGDQSNPNTLPFNYGLRVHPYPSPMYYSLGIPPDTTPRNQSLWELLFNLNFNSLPVIKVGYAIIDFEKK